MKKYLIKKLQKGKQKIRKKNQVKKLYTKKNYKKGNKKKKNTRKYETKKNFFLKIKKKDSKMIIKKNKK